MKAIVTWQQVVRSEIWFDDQDLADMQVEGVDLEDGLAIAAWAERQEWMAEGLQDNWYEKEAPEYIDIEPQEDDGTLL